MGSDSLRPAMATLAGLQVFAAAAYLVAMGRWRRSVIEKSIWKE
jgi:hypothetical protein